MGETWHLERSRSSFVLVDGTRPEARTGTCDFEGGRSVAKGGATRVFSGPPPAALHPRLERPGDPADAGEAGRAVRALLAACGGQGRLRLCTTRTERVVVGTTLEPCRRTSAVWALTGQVFTSGGRFVPVGWSGREDCLPRLRDGELCEALVRTVRALERAGPCPGGAVPAVLAATAAAVLVHEAAGHFAEASPEPAADVGHRLGVRIASELVSLEDDPLAEGGAARYEHDDDGVASLGPTLVVHQGILVAQLHSLASARAFGGSPTANGRATSAWDTPIPRMSNLLCSPGSTPDEELLDHLGRGLFVHQLSFGFSFGSDIEARIVLAEAVEHGRRTGRLLSGGLLAEDRGVLRRVVEAGDRSAFNPNALCGKAGQLLFDVGTRAPALRFAELRMRA